MIFIQTSGDTSVNNVMMSLIEHWCCYCDSDLLTRQYGKSYANGRQMKHIVDNQDGM